MRRYFSLLLCMALLCVAIFPVAVSAGDSKTLRVDLYENPPKIFADSEGNASGFWPDIIEYIAAEEGWEIEYIHGTWAECLERLEKNEIDVMPDTAFTEPRSKKFAFSNETVLVSWSRVYAQEGADIQSILDLEGKTIAVLRGSVNVEGPEGIKEIVGKFDFGCTFTEVGSYTKVFELLESKKADAGVTNKDFGSKYEEDFDVERTPIIFQPVHLQFAFTKDSGLTPYLIERIDYQMKVLKADKDSIYYQSMEKYLGVKPEGKPVVPGWVKWLLAGMGGLALLFFGGSLILRSRVLSRTKELRQKITERKRAQERVEHLSLVLRTVRNVNQLIAKEKDRDKLLKGACDNLVETRGYFNAWITLLDESGKLTAHAESGLGKDFLPVVERLKRGQLLTCMQRALKQSKAVVTEDPVSACTDCPLSSSYAGRSAATARLEYEGKIYGLLSVSVPHEMAIDVEELGLFHEVATDIAFALHNIELEEKRKQEEEELAKYREHLEELVEQRTRDLKGAQEELLRSERLATLGQFSGSISHELRNPLAVIGSSVYYMEEKLEGADRKVLEHLGRIKSSVSSSTAIIESLLNLTRMQAPRLKKLDFRAVISDAIASSKVPTGVEVVRNFPKGELVVNADGEQLRMAFKNIIKNAVEAMDNKGTLTITACVTVDKQAEVSFADTGPGIAAENLEKVFQPLFSTRAKGIGFGLSIARMIIDKHGGTIEARSEPGEGAVITIRLPA